MDKSIPMLLIGLVFGGGLGFTIAAANGITLDGHDHGDHGHGAHEMGEMSDEHAHHAAMHEMPHILPEGAGAPSLDLVVHEDPASGWNLELVTSSFSFAPQNASEEHIPGEGHAHLYINGEKIGRLYGHWVHLSELPEGENLIEVDLNGNDHRPLQVGEARVAQSVSITVE